MELLTGKEAAELLRCSPRVVQGMMRRRELDGFIRGRTTRVTRESVDRLLRQTKPTPQRRQKDSMKGAA